MTHSHDARGSDEAIRKRRAARALNALLAPEAPKRIDGRTEIRRKRLLSELERNSNNRGKALKPVDILLHVDELLSMGETVERLRKVVRVSQVPLSEDTQSLVTMLSELHEAYGFRRETYDFLGIPPGILESAGIGRPRRGRPPKSSRASENP